MASVSVITEEQLSVIREHIRATLSSARASHIFGVEKTASEIGHSLLPDKIMLLRLSALLHDITKEWTTDQHLSFLSARNIPVSDAVMHAPALLHALSGAHYAKETYPDIVDEEVFFAILHHTTGNAEMTVFQTIIYVSDLIEEGRTHPFCLEIRKKFISDRNAYGIGRALELAFFASLQSTVFSFAKNARVIAPETIAAYNSILFRDSEIH